MLFLVRQGKSYCLKTRVLNLCEVCETSQLLRQKVLKPSKSAVFARDGQKDTFFMSTKSQKNRRGRKMYQKNTPEDSYVKLQL